MRSFFWIGLLCALGYSQSPDESEFFQNGHFSQRSQSTPGLEQSLIQEASSEDNAPSKESLLPDEVIPENEYILGPGDVLNVSLGLQPSFKVDPQGMLAFPGIAPINVSGLSLTAAKKAIKRSLTRNYDTSKVFISLARANQFKVSLQGEVAKPGSRATNSFTRVADLIKLAGGFTRQSVRDSITILRADGTRVSVSLLNAFEKSNSLDNPLLRFGDQVIVKRVDLAGPYCTIKYEGHTFYHQLTPNSQLANILFEISNFSKKSGFFATQVTHSDGTRITVSPDRFFDFIPSSGDTVEFVGEVQTVFVGGSVAQPGAYKYYANFSAADYSFLAGMNPESSSRNKFRIFRDGKIISSENEPLPVRPGDKIYVKRDGMYMTRDYLTIVASLASIIISSVTLYITASK